MPMSTCGRLVLVALCLTWTCAIRALAQVSNPPSSHIRSEPSNHCNVSETQPAASSSCSPCKELQLIYGVAPPAGDRSPARSRFDGFDFPCDGVRGGRGASGLDIVGDPAAGDMRADGEAGMSSSSTASQPAPFGGPWNSRPKLTGDWGGLREQLRDHGFTFDVSATTYYQGIASGGLQDTFRFGGRNDYLLNVDGQKAGLWEGLGINLHGETVYGDSVNLLTGAVVPVNIGRSLPVPVGTVSALTAVKFTQALSENLILYAGKINTVDNLQQPFMPGRGLDAGFMNGAFVFNPVLGRTIPYSTFGAGGAILAGGQPVVTLTVYDTHDASTTSVFDKLFHNGAIIYPTLSLPTNFFGMPGHQTVWGAYSSGRYAILSPESLLIFPPPVLGLPPTTGILSPESLLIFPPPVPGLPPTTLVRGSWWIDYRFDQALWVDPTDETRSWGVFGDAGISDGNPNPIHWSVILGIGGSSPIPNRKLDTFGIAYYYMGLSDDFKNVVRPIVPVRDERGLELFYNVAVTPWFHVTPDLQVITPTLELAKTSLVLGLRAKIDF
jgi:porin